MKYIYTALLVLILYAQLAASSIDSISTTIMDEGKLLCRLEKASWYATDYFLEKLESKKDSLGGYLSYQNNDRIVSIFFSRYDSSHILARFTFGLLPRKEPLSVDILNNAPTPEEIGLITIRQDAFRRIYSDTTGFFRHYDNTSFNLIPINNHIGKKVFVLTGPGEAGNVLIGNDYLFTYKANNEFAKKEKLHNSLITFPYKGKENKVTATTHSHILSEYITSTDVCTLLLYKDFLEWNQHIVFSQNYVSILDLGKETLIILTKEAFNKIYNRTK